MQDPPLLKLALTILTVDLLRYALTAGAVWLLVERLLGRQLAGRRILQATRRPGQLRRELTYSLATVLIFASNGLLVWLLAANGTLVIYSDVAERGWAWWWLSLALIIVAHDAYFYWTHRWLHHRRWFRAVHGIHHTSQHPTPWAAYAFHPVEALIQAAFLPVFLLLVPMHTAAIGVFLLHMIARNTIGHCAHELLPWRWTPRGWLRAITPVSHHHFHHARNRGNYGLYFTWWDRWCGTEDADYLREGDRRFGIPARAGEAS
ncbi:MAG TPA: sterol desaturase family protein [Burkholderiaceae bacterium]|nr:sterol desaturase family protein [Burkholderiaceae bacterium]